MIAGDWRWFWPETIRYFSLFPQAWDSSLNTGIGQSGLSTLWINQYLNLTASLTKVGFSWQLIALVFWQLPPLVLSALGAYNAFGLLFPKLRKWGYIAAVVYTCNTYFFLMYLGGQLGVALAYGIFPFVIGRFVSSLIRGGKTKTCVVNGFLFGLLILFDIRISFIAVLIIVLGWLYVNRNVRDFFRSILGPLFIAAGLHAYWILPLLVYRQNPLAGAGVVPSGDVLSFFSFADFSHALSLLHPNWPENIFGKSYFLQPEFLLIPLAAFFVLAIVKEHIRSIRFLAFMALTGVFLSKGVKEPFGGLYEWLYTTIPGFVMFRDPTKFYIVTAFSYAMLIPHAISWASEYLHRLLKNRHTSIIVKLMFIALWMIPLRTHTRTILQSFGGYTIPEEYGRLTRFLADQPQFFRTLWIPQWQRFGYFSDMHPAIGRFDLLTDATPAGQLKQLEEPGMREKLSRLGVKYIIVPYDSEGELFVNDRRYDEEQYVQTMEVLRMKDWVTEKGSFGRIGVFELEEANSRFFIEGQKGTELRSQRLSSTYYTVSADSPIQGTVIFSEAFDPLWVAYAGMNEIVSSQTPDGLNSFVFPSEVSELHIAYRPQQGVTLGLVLTTVTLGGILVTYVTRRK